jgi:hypothetical protein
MPTRDDDRLLRTGNFAVLIGDRELGFTQVGRLSSVTDFPEPQDRPIHHFGTVVLRRALTSSTELYDWRRVIVDGKDDRRDVTIRQLSAPGGEVVNSWRLVQAWPCRWSGPVFDAMSNDIAFEELELTFDDLIWLKHDATSKGD